MYSRITLLNFLICVPVTHVPNGYLRNIIRQQWNDLIWCIDHLDDTLTAIEQFGFQLACVFVRTVSQ